MRLSDQIKLRHLEVFLETARLKSVSRAAEALSLTQPAVSRTLRELETTTGKTLFERDGRGIRLSPFGEMLLPHAGAAITATRAGLDTLAGVGAASGAPLRLGALPTVSSTLIPSAVAAFRSTGVPGRLWITTGENRVLLDQLRRGDLDLMVGRLPAPELMLGLSFEPLFKDRVTLVVAEGHPLLAGALTADRFGGFPMLLPGPDSIIRPYAEQLFMEQGLPLPHDAIETVSDSFGRAFTRDHGAVWVISRGVVASELARGVLVELPLDTTTTLGSVGIMRQAEAAPHPSAERFARALRGAVKAAV
jgi:LysR family pca operon transcriptional activator